MSTETGFLVKQGGRIKTWKKRYFALIGLRLRWYDSEDAYAKHERPKGEIVCAKVETIGKGRMCIRDATGMRDLVVRSGYG